MRSKIYIGRHYYKDCVEYVVKDFCSKDNRMAIVVTKLDDPKSENVVEFDEFVRQFTPVYLELGDVVKAVSMGKVRQLLIVKRINDGGDYPVSFMNSPKHARRKVSQRNMSVEMNFSDQATDYFLVTYEEDNTEYCLKLEEISDKLQAYRHAVTNPFPEDLKDLRTIKERINEIYKIVKQ